MQSHDSIDPVIAEADQRAERAKASLRSRIAQLEQRFGDVREQLDVPAHIKRHPLPAIGIALVAGALIGRHGTAGARVSGERTLGGMALAAAAAVGLRIVREVAMGQVSRIARQWWSEHGGPAYDSDRQGDYEAIDVTPGAEPFLTR